MTKFPTLAAAAFALLTSTATISFANTLFEGWFEVYKGADKIGFMVERYQFENNKFIATYYLKTNAEGNSVTESVKAFSKNDLTPLSYGYTTKVGDNVKIIDATFKNDVETLTINDGKKKTTETHKIKKGTFLSEFLMYLILLQKDGLTSGKSYDYFAIAEEDGEVHDGHAYIKDEEDVKGRKAFKILNEYKGEKFFTWVTAKGEPLLTRSPDSNIDVRFADSREQAMKGMMVNLNDIKYLFGSVPGDGGSASKPPAELGAGKSMKEDESESDSTGKETKKTKEKKKKLFEKHPVKPGKDAGVPAGQGIEIKGVKPPKTPDEPAEDKPVTTGGGGEQGK